MGIINTSIWSCDQDECIKKETFSNIGGLTPSGWCIVTDSLLVPENEILVFCSGNCAIKWTRAHDTWGGSLTNIQKPLPPPESMNGFSDQFPGSDYP